MGVGELIFWICVLYLLKNIMNRSFDLVEYKMKNSNKEVTGLCKCMKDIVDVQEDKYESILDEDDLKDLSDDELISFNDIKESDLTNENK